jgi:hypothetical protein
VKGHDVFDVLKFQLLEVHVSEFQVSKNQVLEVQVLKVHILNIQVPNKDHVATLALGLQPRQEFAKVRTKSEAWESHFMLSGVWGSVGE